MFRINKLLEAFDRSTTGKLINNFLSKYGRKSQDEPEEWSSPDMWELERVAKELLDHNLPVTSISYPNVSFLHGGFPDSSESEFKDIMSNIKSILRGK